MNTLFILSSKDVSKDDSILLQLQKFSRVGKFSGVHMSSGYKYFEFIINWLIFCVIFTTSLKDFARF